MRIAITGASGFIGRPLVDLLRREGHEVLTIGRGGTSDVRWDPSRGELDAVRLAGIHGVIHLAGEPIAQRWTEATKRAIRESRVLGTNLVARTMTQLSPRPSVLISMSGVGAYGDRNDEVLDEKSAPGSGFLAETAVLWERSADAAREAGIRVIHPRLGIALHRSGGALEKLVPIFSLGAGGRIGSGRQWMSWISRTDVLRALQFMLVTETLSGPVNLVSPNPARNADFTDALAKALHRPAFAAVPEFAIRLLYGEMGQETVVAGQRVTPAALLGAGFRFEHPDLPSALAAALSP